MTRFDALVFGGTFDPVHEGHLSVIEYLRGNRANRPEEILVIAPTAKNPWKLDREPTSLTLRLQMWELVLTEAGIPWSYSPELGKVWLCSFEYVYAFEFVEWFRTLYPGTIRWVLSEDSAGQEAQWRNWTALAVESVYTPVQHPVHATDVREGKKRCLPVLQKLIDNNGLYRQ